MNWILASVLVMVCLWQIAIGLSRRGKAYEFPFLVGAITLGFVVPQLPGLAADPFLPNSAFAKTIAFTILCLVMSSVGWAVGNRPLALFQWTLDERRLLIVGAVLSVMGAFFFYQLSRLPYEIKSVSQLSGLPVAYLFFAKLLPYGFGIVVLCFLHRPSKLAVTVILFDLIFFLDRIVIAGRRGETSEFVLLIVLAIWFKRRRALPRGLVLIGILAVALALHSTESYRTISTARDGPQWSEVLKIDVIGNIKEVAEKGGGEMRNAMLRINTIDRTHAFDYGVFHWNTTVGNFVPAQLVGARAKELLYIPTPGQYDRDYHPDTGTTETGMADAFGSFWYFGALKFFLLAYILGRIYAAAMAGNTVCQLIYALSLTSAMLAITHHTQTIVSVWVHMAMFLLPALLAACIGPYRRTPALPANPGQVASSQFG